MFQRVIRTTLVVLILSAVGDLHAGTEAALKKTHIVMGGTTLGIRSTAQQDMEVAFNAAMSEFLKGSGTDLRVKIYAGTQELYAAFDKHEIDGIFGTAVEYFGREGQYGKDVMALGYTNGGVKQSFVVVARRSGGIATLEDLRSKRLTLAKYQDTEAIYLNTLLLKRRLPEIPVFFLERADAKNPNIAIMDVFFNRSDVTVVRESEYLTANELNPQIDKQLFILTKSPPYIPALGSVRKEISGENIDNLAKAIRKYGSTDSGRKVLSISQANSIEVVSAEDIQSVRGLLSEYQSLKKMNNANAIAPQPVAKMRSRRNAQ